MRKGESQVERFGFLCLQKVIISPHPPDNFLFLSFCLSLQWDFSFVCNRFGSRLRENRLLFQVTKQCFWSCRFYFALGCYTGTNLDYLLVCTGKELVASNWPCNLTAWSFLILKEIYQVIFLQVGSQRGFVENSSCVGSLSLPLNFWELESVQGLADSPGFHAPDFLSACYLCRRQLSHGKDIYMYRCVSIFSVFKTSQDFNRFIVYMLRLWFSDTHLNPG